MQFLTDFADQRLTLPLSLVLALALACSGWRRGAWAWCGVILGTLGCLAALKTVFLACGPHWTGGVLTSPSGHTAAAALTYGGFARLVLRPRGGTGRRLLALLPPLLAVLAGLTRLALHVHTPAEVLAGGLLGCAGAWLLPRLAGPPPALRLRRLLLPAALPLVLLHGGRLQAEGLLRGIVIDGVWPPAACRMAE